MENEILDILQRGQVIFSLIPGQWEGGDGAAQASRAPLWEPSNILMGDQGPVLPSFSTWVS